MKKSAKILGIDSLRFIAFFTVFIYHTIPKMKYGYLGIDLFFVLSSFLLTNLALEEIKLSGTFSKRNFFIRRALRIYPLYYLVVLFCFLAIPFLNKTNIPLENHWMYFLFLSNLDTSNNPFPLKLLWSIAVEEQFYIIFILISPLFKRFLGLVVLIMLLSSITITALLLKQNIGVYSFLSTYLLDFSIGIFFGKLFFEQRKMNIIFMGIYLIIITPLLFYIFTLNSYIDNYLNLPISIAFGVLIYITTLIFKTKKINKLPLFKATEYLGQYTYSLYVLSGLTITFIVGFVPLKSILFASLLKLILLVPIAFLSFHFYEKPFLRLKERFR